MVQLMSSHPLMLLLAHFPFSCIRFMLDTINDQGSTGFRDAALECSVSNGRLHFILFETRRMHRAIQLITSANILHPDTIPHLSVTGGMLMINLTAWSYAGGAYRFSNVLEQEWNTKVKKQDEMKTLVRGLDFLVNHFTNELFSYDDVSLERVPFRVNQDELYPYLLVNVGTGVSFIKVVSPDKFERVSGSAVGGGTYWGFAVILTHFLRFVASTPMTIIIGLVKFYLILSRTRQTPHKRKIIQRIFGHESKRESSRV